MLSAKLGPRAIPFLKDIVKTCVSYSKESINSTSGISQAYHKSSQANLTLYSGDASIVHSASNVLRNLLTSIPTFWGEADILSVVELYLDSSQANTADAAELTLLVKATAKRTTPNVLLPALCNMWTRLSVDASKVRSLSTDAGVSADFGQL